MNPLSGLSGEAAVRSRGFTLIEVLLGSLIFFSVVVVSIGLFATTVGSQSRSQVLRRVNSEGRLALETIAREVRLSGCLVGSPSSDCPFEIADSTGLVGPEGVRLRVFALEDGSVKTFLLREVNGHRSLALEVGGITKDITGFDLEVKELLFEAVPGGTPGVKITLVLEHPGSRRVAQASLELSTQVHSRDPALLGALP